MKISFHGAAREVTGSCMLVETDETRILVDCGMFQGGSFCEARNSQAFAFDPSTVDAVFVTHAHLDHVGRLPKLVKEGFHGRVYMTTPTVDLVKMVLEDAYTLMHEDFEREYRPKLYEHQHVRQVFERTEAVEYEKKLVIGDLNVRWREAGHIFGSAFIEISERGGGTATFSGDLGNVHVPILRDTSPLAATDVVIVESTYGNRVHEDESQRTKKLRAVVEKTIRQRGVLLIPAFAIERTQQLLHELHELIQHDGVQSINVYLDSPMAIQATDIIMSYPQFYDADALRQVSHGDKLFDFPGLHRCFSRDESMRINEADWPKIIIAGAGMMNGGRILHHLVRYLGHASCGLLIIGYQAPGTLGYKLYHGEKVVSVLGQRVAVKARVESIGAYSAHADQPTLINWLKSGPRLPAQVYCTHGDEGAAVALATRVQEELHIEAVAPRLGSSLTL